MTSGDSMAGADGSNSRMTLGDGAESTSAAGGGGAPQVPGSLPGGQIDLFRRPVEPEDLARDLKWEPLDLGRLPSVDEADPAWQRYGLGPILDVPRKFRNCYEAEDRVDYPR